MQVNFGEIEAVAERLLERAELSPHQRVLAISIRGIAETLATKVVAHPEDLDALKVLGCYLCGKLGQDAILHTKAQPVESRCLFGLCSSCPYTASGISSHAKQQARPAESDPKH